MWLSDMKRKERGKLDCCLEGAQVDGNKRCHLLADGQKHICLSREGLSGIGSGKKLTFVKIEKDKSLYLATSQKTETHLNILRKQNSGLSLKGKNKQFTFHSVSVQTKLRNSFL